MSKYNCIQQSYFTLKCNAVTENVSTSRLDFSCGVLRCFKWDLQFNLQYQYLTWPDSYCYSSEFCPVDERQIRSRIRMDIIDLDVLLVFTHSCQENTFFLLLEEDRQPHCLRDACEYSEFCVSPPSHHTDPYKDPKVTTQTPHSPGEYL